MSEDIRESIVAIARTLTAAETHLKELRTRWAIKRKELNARLRAAIEQESAGDTSWRLAVLQAWQESTSTTDYAKEMLATARADVVTLKGRMAAQCGALTQLEISFDEPTTHAKDESCTSTHNNQSAT